MLIPKATLGIDSRLSVLPDRKNARGITLASADGSKRLAARAAGLLEA